MTQPRTHKPGEDDTTDLLVPIINVSHKLIIEEPPFDEEDTQKSRPINDAPNQPVFEEQPFHEEDAALSLSKTVVPNESRPEKPFIDDADTIPTPSKKRGKLNQQSSKNK